MASIALKSSGTFLKFMKHSSSKLLSSSNLISHKIHTKSSTIDPVDLKHVSSFASEWWDPEGPIKPLHSFNVIRVPLIRDSLITLTPDTPQSTCLRGKKILEVGCGPGILTEDLAKLGADLTGIDPSKDLIRAAMEHSSFNTSLTNKPTYIHTTIEEHIKQHSNEYDAVVASEVIEHINTAQRELFVESCTKALKPGGKIIITTPNRTRMSQLLGVFLVQALKVVPRGTHHYHKFTTQDELKYWLELNDCRVDLIQGYVYYFWSHQWKWINWQGLMYAMRAVKLDKTSVKNPSKPWLLPSASFINKKVLVHTNTTNSTVDPADLKHLSKLAADWWNPEGPVKLLHVYNVIRVPFIRDSLVTLSPDTPQSTCLRGKKILEVGCGPGILTEDLAKLGADVTAIDPCKELLQVAIEHSKSNTSLNNKPTYIHTTVEEYIKQHSNEYDAVVSYDVIEHSNTAQREFFVESCVKALKPGGKIIITTPNRTRMAQLLGVYLMEGLNIIPWGTHHYRKFTTPEELKYWLELNDCRVDLVKGYIYYFWSHQFKWIDWKGLMYAMRAVKLDKNI